MSGTLILVPTPLQEELPLEPVALERLRAASADPATLLLVEELKVARQRWLRWGLPRESIERFVAFNEHTAAEQTPIVLQALKAGSSAVLMSDGGLPAFCDPGEGLVDACHRQGLPVTSTPFPNSVALALALSGFSHRSFVFAGFLPQKDPERSLALAAVVKETRTQILMDTPYRRQRLLEELAQALPSDQKGRQVLLALELNGPKERLLRGTLSVVLSKTSELEKQEFVLVLQGPSRA